MNHKVDMYEKNILINTNVLKVCHEIKVKKVISCLSTCIFPDKTTYPINETMLHDGPPHTSNDAYAYAKRMLEVHSRAYQEQYGDNFICVIPTNIYGPHDNFHLKDSHVIPALIHKCYLAKQKNESFVIAGSGTPLRQFIYSEDLAILILWTIESYNKLEPIILSVPESDEKSINYVATCIAKEFNYENNMEFDTNKPDGQFKKTADNSKLISYIKSFNFIPIEEGIAKTVDWFVNNYNVCRK
jgi:GDP-L-fucose synthase